MEPTWTHNALKGGTAAALEGFDGSERNSVRAVSEENGTKEKSKREARQAEAKDGSCPHSSTADTHPNTPHIKTSCFVFFFFSPCHFGNKCYIPIIVKLVRITGQVISSGCSDAETTKELSLPFTVIVPVVCGTPTSVTGYKPDSAGRERAAGRDSNSTPLVRSPCRK